MPKPLISPGIALLLDSVRRKNAPSSWLFLSVKRKLVTYSLNSSPSFKVLGGKMDKLFDLHVKCYLPACFVSMRPWVLCGVWASAQVLSPGALFRDSLGKWGFCSLKQSQGHLLLAGMQTTCGTVNTKKSLSKGFSVAVPLWHSHPRFIEFLKLPRLGAGLCLGMDF